MKHNQQFIFQTKHQGETSMTLYDLKKYNYMNTMYTIYHVLFLIFFLHLERLLNMLIIVL